MAIVKKIYDHYILEKVVKEPDVWKYFLPFYGWQVSDTALRFYLMKGALLIDKGQNDIHFFSLLRFKRESKLYNG